MARPYRFEAEVFLALPLERVFPFFADAFNLAKITPPWLRFEVLTPRPIRMKIGTLIDYRLRVRGLPLRWRSRITIWQPPYRFVDEQIRGPYRLWRHEHTFVEHEGGTLCRDHVDYDMLLGPIVQPLLVGRDVRRIFRHRAQRLHELFNTEPATDDVTARGDHTSDVKHER
jgi:ligand-binding SRPBCC domain-containing protein